ncbi:MAG: FtsX-like permease family protein [Chloroherpetonaceae bacterium]|nr:FtsX-like permease family protein [Chloroherpetonaceae bacterium]
MLKNYLLTAWRNMLRQKTYTVINLIGLALGLASAGMIVLYVADELAFDEFHEKKDRIIRIGRRSIRDGKAEVSAVMPAPFGKMMKEKMTTIESAIRLFKFGGKDWQIEFQSISKGTKFKTNEILFADKEFFNVFSFELIQGNPETALEIPFSMVVSESFAQKRFGHTAIIGEKLKTSFGEVTITGVIKDPPKQSHICFEILGSFRTLELIPGVAWMMDNWSSSSYYTYVLLHKGVLLQQFEQELKATAEKLLNERIKGDNLKIQLLLEPLKDIYLRSELENQMSEVGNMNAILLFSTIGLVILILAGINFINLATARSMRRYKEIGIRKTLGAERKHIAIQFIAESVMLTLLSSIIAIGIIEVLLPEFNAFTEKKLSLGSSALSLLGFTSIPISNTILFFLSAFIVGVAAGLYPAAVLSRFLPSGSALYSRQKSSRIVRKALVVFQFSISAALIIAALIVKSQINYMNSKPLGFSTTPMIVIDVENEEARARLEALKNEFAKSAYIASVSLSGNVPSAPVGTWLMNIELSEGKEPLRTEMNMFLIDDQFIDQYELTTVAGRPYRKGEPLEMMNTEYGFSTQCSRGILLNETAIQTLGFKSPEEALGKKITKLFPGDGEVIGVVKDFHYKSLQTKIEPLALRIFPGQFSSLSLKLSPAACESSESVENTIREIKSIWARVIQNSDLRFSFLSERYEAQYRNQFRFGYLLSVFAVIAVAIGSLGLFGLSAFTAEERTKEIGIRKVLGASVGDIFSMIAADFLKLVGIAFVIAIPITHVVMKEWLNSFAYHTEPKLSLFFFSILLGIMIATITVSAHSIRVALTNPVKSLRYE